MTKIKELLANREALAKYDELKVWKEKFEDDQVLIVRGCPIPYPLPDLIKQTIVSALDAEIKKLVEE